MGPASDHQGGDFDAPGIRRPAPGNCPAFACLGRQMRVSQHGDFPKLGVPYWGVPIIRNKIFWGLDWGPLILGNYHM